MMNIPLNDYTEQIASAFDAMIIRPHQRRSSQASAKLFVGAIPRYS